MISFKSERTRHRIGCGEGVYHVGMGAGGQWAAGEGVADGAHGFRVVKILVVGSPNRFGDSFDLHPHIGSGIPVLVWRFRDPRFGMGIP